MRISYSLAWEFHTIPYPRGGAREPLGDEVYDEIHPSTIITNMCVTFQVMLF